MSQRLPWRALSAHTRGAARQARISGVDPVEDVVVVSMIQLMDSPWSWDNELRALTYQAITKLN